MPQRGRRVPPPAPPRPRAEEAPAIVPAHPRRLSEGSIDLTLPRVCYYRAFEDLPGPCPRCGGALEQEYASYMISTRDRRGLADSFIAGSTAGWFCSRCPAVVIDTGEIGRLLGHQLPGWNVGQEFVVLGIVDLDSVPKEKKHLPLGEDDNPIPLIAFTYESEELR